LTLPWGVAIVEGVLWHKQDCRKIRPLGFLASCGQEGGRSKKPVGLEGSSSLPSARPLIPLT